MGDDENKWDSISQQTLTHGFEVGTTLLQFPSPQSSRNYWPTIKFSLCRQSTKQIF
jgi:hypothetical protein